MRSDWQVWFGSYPLAQSHALMHWLWRRGTRLVHGRDEKHRQADDTNADNNGCEAAAMSGIAIWDEHA